MIIKLEQLGWNNFFEAYFAPYAEKGFSPGRITVQHKERYLLYTKDGEIKGQVSGKFRFASSGIQDFPAVGDWVVIEQSNKHQPAIIHHVLERKSKISRKVAGERTEEQMLAANIDVVFLVMGLDADYNPRRLERYLTAAWESGAKPIVILNKIDKCENLETKHSEIVEIAKGVDVFLMNAKVGTGIEPIKEILKTGVTGVLLGSSGVGKSTITNLLLGPNHEKIRDVHLTDKRGKHLTSHRELLILPSGGLIIDTPGLRELQLWSGEEGIHGSFEDIMELGTKCKFRDCKHDSEPGCAVKKALENGTLDAKRYESYIKLQREIMFHEKRNLIGNKRTEKERWKKISKQINKKFRERDK